MTIYIVMIGDYGDRRVEAAFSTEELAKDYAAYLVAKGDRSADVTPFVLDEVAAKPIKKYWICGLTRLGNRYSSDMPARFVDEDVALPKSCFSVTGGQGVSTRSAEHAVKIAGEVRQAWLRQTLGQERPEALFLVEEPSEPSELLKPGQ